MFSKGFMEEVHLSRGMKDKVELPEGMMNGKIILGKGVSYVKGLGARQTQPVRFRN